MKGLLATTAIVALAAGCSNETINNPFYRAPAKPEATLVAPAYDSTDDGPIQIVSTTDYQRPARTLSTDSVVDGHELRRTTQSDLDFRLEGIIVNETPVYEHANTSPGQGEFKSYFILRQNHQRVPGTDDQEVTAKAFYVPKQVMVDDGSGTMVLSTRLPLSTTGRYGQKALFDIVDGTNIQTGIFTETEQHARYNIATITMADGQEFYIPITDEAELKAFHKEVAAGNFPDSMPWYIVPKGEGLDPELDKFTGQITLVSPEGYWKAERVWKSAYETRTPPKPALKPIPPIPPGSNPGDAEDPQP